MIKNEEEKDLINIINMKVHDSHISKIIIKNKLNKYSHNTE